MEQQVTTPSFLKPIAPEFQLPNNTTLDKPTQTALLILTARNRKLNAVKPDFHLAEQPTPAMIDTAKRLVEFQKTLKQQAGPQIATEFLTTPYNITWMEQILDIDPNKVALVMQTRDRVHAVITQEHIDPQFEPALALGAYTGIERLHELKMDHETTTTAIAKIRSRSKEMGSKDTIDRHLIHYLEALPQDERLLIGSKRDELLTTMITKDIANRLEIHSRHAAILQQSQGVEVEVLQHLEWVPTEQRDTARKQAQMSRIERYGIRDWLPRGIRQEDHERMDWHLTHMLGIPEDVGEKKFEWFEMSTAPTDGGPAQSTILHELTLAGFISPELLSNTWEKYSMHASTVFPERIWNQNAQDQYVLHARALAGAFASTQRGVYGGYVFDDTRGREIADKTLEGQKKFAAVAGKGSESKSGKKLVEMRVFDLTERGQYAIELHKPYLDFAFKCYWEHENGQPLQNIAEYRAVNAWNTYFQELSALYKRYDIPINADVYQWRSVGWKKAEQPQLQTDLAKLIRKTAGELRHIVNEEIAHPESLPPQSETPISLLGKRTITSIETPETALHDPRIILSQQEANILHLQDNQLFFMRFGETKIPAFIHIDTARNQDTSFTINKRLQKLLHMPEHVDLSLRFNPIEQEIDCGPLLGIPVRVEDPTLQEPFGEQTAYHKNLILTARKQGVVAYSFDVSSNTDNFNVNEKTITGITLSEDGTKWIETTLPYPDVILSRNFGERSRDKMGAIAHIPFVNHPDFVDLIADKVELPRAICENPRLRPYVPETMEFTGLSALEDMMKKHETVYLKPTWGMRSEGVVRFDRLPDGTIRYTHTIQGTDPLDTSYGWPEPGQDGYGGKIVPTVQEALHATDVFRKQFIYDKYIMQQGIEGIPGNEGRPLELRFLFQRDETGKPAIIGWDQGQKDFWMPTINKLFGEHNAETVTTNATTLAKALSLQIQRHFGPQFGQYSIQIAVDKVGKTWLLEANPKPGVTNQFHAIQLDNVVDYASDHLLRHIQNMAGFTPNAETPQQIERVTLQDGTTAIASEETNPYVIYKFAQESMKGNIRQRETSVYNLKTLQRIQENMANRTRYIMLRDETTNIPLGCISILRPKSQQYYDLAKPDHPLENTKKRWEIGGVLTAPEARGKGIGRKLFDTAISEITKSPIERDTYNNINITEILVNVTGTYDGNRIGESRPDSIGIEKIVQNIPGSRPLQGAVPGSLGPIYIIPFIPKTQ